MRAMTKLVLAGSAAVLLAGTATARDNEPHHEYACEVQTEAGVAGLVVIQATEMEKARTGVGLSLAHTVGGERSPVMSVVECIKRPEGKFRDSQFQRFYERGVYERVLE